MRRGALYGFSAEAGARLDRPLDLDHDPSLHGQREFSLTQSHSHSLRVQQVKAHSRAKQKKSKSRSQCPEGVIHGLVCGG